MTPTHKPSGRQRHLYVQFYMDDWTSGTSRMPRIVRSVYFEICCYTWDKAQPVPAPELRLMVSDLPPEQGGAIVDMLVDSGKLVRNPDGSVYSRRALAEAERALEVWQKRSAGGKAKRKDKSKSDAAEQEETSNTHRQNSIAQNSIAQSSTEQTDESNASSGESGAPEGGKPAADGDAAAIDVPRYTTEELQAVGEAWNAMARKCGLSQITQITEERRKKLKERCGEHTPETIIDAIKSIPQSPFLMGINDRKWKANFDFVLRPEACAKLIEGAYHNQGEGERNAWLR